MMKSKKKILGVFNYSFWENLVGGDIAFLFFLKGTIKKNKLGNPGLDLTTSILKFIDEI